MFRRLLVIAVLVVLSTQTMGMYDAKQGRFMQQDPLGTVPNAPKPNEFEPTAQYTNGVNVYEYVGSKPISVFDPYGLMWKISRNGSFQANATILISSETIADLSSKIGLEESQFREWLTLVTSPLQTSNGKKTLSTLQLNDKICPNQTVKIPNMVIAYWGGWGGGIGKHFVDWGRDISTLNKRGFHVLETEGKTANDLEFVIESFMATKKLHGIFAWGHGSPASFITVESENGNPLYNSSYANWDPIYKMGLGVVWACHSGEGGLNSFVSSNGITEGHVGVLVPLPFHMYGPTMNAIIPPGTQGTKK